MTTAIRELPMPPAKKPVKTASDDDKVQISFRGPAAMKERIEACAEAMTTDLSGLLRSLVYEFLPEFEERAAKLSDAWKKPD